MTKDDIIIVYLNMLCYCKDAKHIASLYSVISQMSKRFRNPIAFVYKYQIVK